MRPPIPHKMVQGTLLQFEKELNRLGEEGWILASMSTVALANSIIVTGAMILPPDQDPPPSAALDEDGRAVHVQ